MSEEVSRKQVSFSQKINY